MALLDEVMARFTSQSVASTGSTAGSTGWLLTARELQDHVDRGVAVVASGGFQDEPRAGTFDRPTFQVLVRGARNSSTELEDTVAAVDAALNQHSGVLGGWTYIDIRRQSDVLYLGRDDNQRPLYSVNYLALRSKTSG